MTDQQRLRLAAELAGGVPAFPEMPSPSLTLESADAGRTHYSSYSPVDLRSVLTSPTDTPTTVLGELSLPSGEREPTPAIVFLPGSAGVLETDRQQRWEAWFLDRRIAVFFVDPYGPRGRTAEMPYAQALLATSPIDIVADAYGALRLLDSHPRIDSERIGLMGLSLGGACVRTAMDDRFRHAYAAEHPGFAAFVDFYGPCTEDLGTRRTNGGPLLTARGTADESNDQAACEATIAQLERAGSRVDVRWYDGVAHGWDALTERAFFAEFPWVAGCHTSYDEAARPLYRGEPISIGEPAGSRAERIAARLQVLAAASGDLRFGYTNGRDDEAARRAEADLAEFLRDALSISTGA